VWRRRPSCSVSRFAHPHFGSKAFRWGVIVVVRLLYTHVPLRKCGFCEDVWTVEAEYPVPMALTPFPRRPLTRTVVAVLQSDARQWGDDTVPTRTPNCRHTPSLVGCAPSFGISRMLCVESVFPRGRCTLAVPAPSRSLKRFRIHSLRRRSLFGQLDACDSTRQRQRRVFIRNWPKHEGVLPAYVCGFYRAP
jgi:hypothetical protein